MSITRSYAKKLLSPQWRAKRELILRRDGYACRRCASPENLQVHHICYLKTFDKPNITQHEPWETPSSALITLCEDCHKEEDANKKHVDHRFVRIFRLIGLTNDELMTIWNNLHDMWAFSEGDSAVRDYILNRLIPACPDEAEEILP